MRQIAVLSLALVFLGGFTLPAFADGWTSNSSGGPKFGDFIKKNKETIVRYTKKNKKLKEKNPQ